MNQKEMNKKNLVLQLLDCAIDLYRSVKYHNDESISENIDEIIGICILFKEDGY